MRGEGSGRGRGHRPKVKGQLIRGPGKIWGKRRTDGHFAKYFQN